MIKGFFISSRLHFLAPAFLACLLASCQTIDSVEREGEIESDRRAEKRGVSNKKVVYHGLAYDISIPAEMKTNTKKNEREIIHYFFTPEMAHRKVGMGIYEGIGAKSMVRLRNDLIQEESSPADIDLFLGNVQRGVTFKGKRWSEYFLFPRDANFTLQIFWFDVEPEDEAIFRDCIRTIKGTYKRNSRD
jgi:hypothetical protein